MEKDKNAAGKYSGWFSLILAAVCLAVLMICAVRAWAEATAIHVGDADFCFDLPEGYAVFGQDGNAVISNGSEIVGGVIGYLIPDGVYDPYDKWFNWLEDVGIPDYTDKTLMLDGAMSDFGSGWTAYFRRAPEGNEVSQMMRSHHFTVQDDMVYDAWINVEIVGEDEARTLAGGIQYIAPPTQYKTVTLTLEGEEVSCKLEQIIRRGYTVYLPESGWPFGAQEILNGIPTDALEYGENENIKLHIATLGGKDLRQAQQWLMENWPEYEMTEDEHGNIDGMDSQGNVLKAEFHCAGNVTYAVIQMYPMEAEEGGGAWLRAFAETFALNEGTAMSQEEADFLKCLAVMGRAGFSGDGAIWISSDQERNGAVTSTQYLVDEENSMVITEITQGGFRREALMEVGDTRYCNSGHESEAGEIIWHPCEEEHEVIIPAIASSVWNKHSTRYMGRRSDEMGECISYTVIGFDEGGDEVPVRSVKFYFDSNGTFVKCQWESLADWANDYSTATESFVSIASENVSDEIQREYLQAAK